MFGWDTGPLNWDTGTPGVGGTPRGDGYSTGGGFGHCAPTMDKPTDGRLPAVWGVVNCQALYLHGQCGQCGHPCKDIDEDSESALA